MYRFSDKDKIVLPQNLQLSTPHNKKIFIFVVLHDITTFSRHQKGEAVDINLDLKAELLCQKIKHYLIATIGRSATECNIDEFYRAFCLAFREEIMVNWLANSKTFRAKDVRMLYYLSMEYLPGRLLANNLTNLHSMDLVKLVTKKMNHDFSEVIAREMDPALGNGGLGRLASCFMDSLATMHLPAQGYGLRYQYGIFEQQIWDGVQIERPDCWLINENPHEFRRDQRRKVIKYGGLMSSRKNTYGEEIYDLHDYEEVRALPFDLPIIGYCKDLNFSVRTLRLWTTKESPRNFQLQRYNAGRLDQAAENTTLTDVLYPSDHHDTGRRIRLKQEFLLVSASLQDIIHHHLADHDNMDNFADKVRIQINDTHPAMVVPELMRRLTKHHGYRWEKAWEITQQVVSYTNHTVLQEALEQWDIPLMQYLLPRQYRIVERINQQLCDEIRKHFPRDEGRVQRMSVIQNGRVRMANLSVCASHRINGVAELHTDILRHTIFKDFVAMRPEKFISITNGVTQRRWLLHCNPDLAAFITERVGDAWITDFNSIGDLANFAGDRKSQIEFLAVKMKNKQRLIDYIRNIHVFRDQNGNPTDPNLNLDSASLFDVHIKRFHEYKRQLLNAMHLIMLYQELLADPKSPRIKRTVLFAGKAAAGYEAAKNILRLIHCIARAVNNQPEVSQKLQVVLLENYNVSQAEYIIPAADISQQISTAGNEASGTGNMKLSINGALTLGTNDGANIEMRQHVKDQWWPFAFGCSTEEIRHLQLSRSYNPFDIYAASPAIAKAVDALRDRSLVHNDNEHQALLYLYDNLMQGHYTGVADRYFVLKDLEDYYETQKRVEELYINRYKWAEFAIHNIAGMGPFSSDNSIKNYCELVWELKPCPADPAILEKVREDFSEHSRARL